MRLFASDIEDKPWYNDREMWPRYLTMLATQRFNRFNLSLGLGYDFLRRVTDAYFLFPYPFLLSVPGYNVRAAGLPDACVQIAPNADRAYVAAILEAEVDNDGEIAICRVTAAVDCGTVVNPDSVEAQIQGGLIFGLTAALYDEITIAKGRVQQSNFHNYRIMRINETPAIEVHLERNGEAPGGIGEPGTSIAGL